MRLTMAAFVIGIGLSLFAVFTNSEPVIFILPEDSAALATYNSMHYWRTVAAIIGPVTAAIASLKWMISARYRGPEQ